MTEVFNFTEDYFLDLTQPFNFSNSSADGYPAPSKLLVSTEIIFLIIPYVIIFLLAVSGNLLVIATLVVNKKMRTVTNAFLFNLAVSDLLLGVLCMPFTLSGVLLREFLFGNLLCKLIPYFQAVSVSVSSWTLVSMSIERYFAICHPLKSRKWQTKAHAYKTIASVWIGSCICMLPILVLSKLQTIKQTEKHKCRESWPSEESEKTFAIFLDVALLVVPLAVMSVTYSLIIRALWKAMYNCTDEKPDSSPSCVKGLSKPPKLVSQLTYESSTSMASESQSKKEGGSMKFRKTNTERSIIQRRRVVKMLFVVVLEFFVCWTPLYAINTIALYDSNSVYSVLGYAGVCSFQLLAYASSCCNPVTYCFMNERFRKSFLKMFLCRKVRVP